MGRMEFGGDSLDEVMFDLYSALLADAKQNVASRGATVEFLGATVRLTRPRARLSRSENRGKPFSALGELLWYLAGSDELGFIEPYISRYRKEASDGVIPGAYGPRIFRKRGGIDQIDSVTRLLRFKPNTRRAVIELYEAEDIDLDYPVEEDPNFPYPEVPCTVGLQFLLRDGRLHLSAMMRSNDALKGLPHDVFCFTMLQEMVARRRGVELGEYVHHAGSMHLYVDDLPAARRYLEEGHQRVAEMPPMPVGDPFLVVDAVLEAERRVSAGETVDAAHVTGDEFWADIVRLLQIYWASGDGPKLDALKAELVCRDYRVFVEGRKAMDPRLPRPRAPVNLGGCRDLA